jgi:ferredoxin, 2Fe-2S
MATITILPSGLKIEVEPGKTLLKAAVENKLCWAHTCGGKAQCGACAYTIVSGSENLTPLSRNEQHQVLVRRGRQTALQTMKLACQTVVNGDVIVQKHIIVV